MEIILGEQKDPSTRESNMTGDTQFARMRGRKQSGAADGYLSGPVELMPRRDGL